MTVWPKASPLPLSGSMAIQGTSAVARQERLVSTIIEKDEDGISTDALLWLISMEGSPRFFSCR